MEEFRIRETLDVAGDPRKRSQTKQSRIEVQIFVNPSEEELEKLPGYRRTAIDWARDQLEHAGNLEEFLDKVFPHAVDAGATVRIS